MYFVIIYGNCRDNDFTIYGSSFILLDNSNVEYENNGMFTVYISLCDKLISNNMYWVLPGMFQFISSPKWARK